MNGDKETFLPYILVILKHSLQNYQNIWKKYLFSTTYIVIRLIMFEPCRYHCTYSVLKTSYYILGVMKGSQIHITKYSECVSKKRYLMLRRIMISSHIQHGQNTIVQANIKYTQRCHYMHVILKRDIHLTYWHPRGNLEEMFSRFYIHSKVLGCSTILLHTGM